jgi:tRNA G10  N-methylase Trm11
MAGINDLNLKKWKEYSDLLTDSLWLISERDKSGGHRGDYHGNFVPQIPSQLIRRFTKKGDVVLDPFLGSGTTLIESRRLGRYGIGVELVPDVATIAAQNLKRGDLSSNPEKSAWSILVTDSTQEKARQAVEKTLTKWRKKSVQLLILHPPYHDIIKFSNKKEDLSNAPTVEHFLDLFGQVVENFVDLLESNRHIAVVIGDKYTNAEWVPLGFLTMNKILERGDMRLKSILVKNMVNNRAKRNQENLWRYRALVGGFYVFRHEYILLFQKK